MHLLERKTIDLWGLWEKGQFFRKVTINELEKHLEFSYREELSFKDLKLRRQLINEGLEKLKENTIQKSHLKYGEFWKKHTSKKDFPKVSVRFINSKVGYGLFAEEILNIGAYVGEYTGIVRKNDEHLTVNDYLYAYPLLDDIGRNYVIDAKEGSLTRFINHSYHPNLEPVYAFAEGIYHMLLLAKRPISKGEQLTYNYGKKYWAVRSAPEEMGYCS